MEAVAIKGSFVALRMAAVQMEKFAAKIHAAPQVGTAVTRAAVMPERLVVEIPVAHLERLAMS
jgi:hypothetical protein